VSGTTLLKEERIFIPERPERRIKVLSRQIKPVVQFEDKKKYYIKETPIFLVSYLPGAMRCEEAVGLEFFCNIKTYHRYICPDVFKAVISEVLAQVPRVYYGEKKIVAFEIVGYPKTLQEIRQQGEILDRGYHFATTAFYTQSLV